MKRGGACGDGMHHGKLDAAQEAAAAVVRPIVTDGDILNLKHPLHF